MASLWKDWRMAVQKENETPEHDSAAMDKRTNDCSSNDKDFKRSTKRYSEDVQRIPLTIPMKLPRVIEPIASPKTPQVVFSAQRFIRPSPLTASKHKRKRSKESPFEQKSENRDSPIMSESIDEKRDGDELISTPLIFSNNQNLNSLLASR